MWGKSPESTLDSCFEIQLSMAESLKINQNCLSLESGLLWKSKQDYAIYLRPGNALRGQQYTHKSTTFLAAPEAPKHLGNAWQAHSSTKFLPRYYSSYHRIDQGCGPLQIWQAHTLLMYRSYTLIGPLNFLIFDSHRNFFKYHFPPLIFSICY